MTGLAFALPWGWVLKEETRTQSRLALRLIHAIMIAILFLLPVVYNYYFLPLGVLSILGVLHCCACFPAAHWLI